MSSSSGSRGPNILQALPDELLAAIVCSEGAGSAWTLEDLLHLSRTCTRFHSIVMRECGHRWATLYEATFKQAMPPGSTGAAALQTFKARYISHSQQLRLKRRVALMQLRSDVQVCERDLARVCMLLQQEKARQQSMREESTSVKRSVQIQSMQAAKAWVPSSIRQQWDVVVSSAPVHPEWRLKQLDNDLAASKLQVLVLKQQEATLKAKLKASRRTLAVLEKG